MDIFEIFDDRKDVSDEFKQNMDYSDQVLEDCLYSKPDIVIDKASNVKSFEDVEQALTDILAFLATEGTKQMDSNTAALLIKTLSDSRTILSSGDLLREDANVQDSTEEKPDEEQPVKEQKVEQNAVSANTAGGDEAKTAEAAEKKSKKPKQSSDTIDESGIKKQISELENYVVWPQNLSSLDADQTKYLARLKKLISQFPSVRKLLKSCLDFAEKEGGTLYPSTVVFLLLIYFSNTPERYIPMFMTKPLYYTVNPLNNARRYGFDRLIDYLRKRFKKSKYKSS